MIKKFLKSLLEKRSNQPFYPLSFASADQSSGETGGLATVKRCLSLYRDLLVSVPIAVCDKKGNEILDHWLVKLLNKPCWLSRPEWTTLLVESYFLHGNFVCYIDSNGKGEIKGLLPYPEGSIFCYSVDNSSPYDPIRIAQSGFYYKATFGDKQSQKKISSNISSENIWHLKNLWQGSYQTSDTLNGKSLAAKFPDVINLALSTQDCLSSFAENGLIPASILSGVGETPAEQKASLRQELEKFFRGGRGRFLTMDDSIKIDPITQTNPGLILQVISSISSMEIARLFNVPLSLVGQETGANVDSGQSLKESHRFFIRTACRGFIKTIEAKLQELLTDNEFIKLKWKAFVAGDMREAGVLPGLIEAGILDKNRATEWLED